MTQIQAYEDMSKEALIEHHLHTLQQHADDMDMLSKELASRQSAINEALAFVRCDASAATYQSLGQYRTGIIKTLSKAAPTTDTD